MVNFKTLTNNLKPQLDREIQNNIISHLKSIQPPKTPLKDLELITVRGISLRCFSFDRSTVDLDKEIINLFKSGYTILTVWGEYDPNVPCVVFTWHPKLLDPVENDLSTTQD